jgi:hypothetical protein
MARRYANALIRDGLFEDQADLDAHTAALMALDADPSNARLAFRFGIGAGITDRRIRLVEISNWLQRMVLR